MPFLIQTMQFHVTVNDTDKHPSLSCYGCGKKHFIIAKCPNYYLSTKIQSIYFEPLHHQSCTINESVTPLSYLKVNGTTVVACADTCEKCYFSS